MISANPQDILGGLRKVGSAQKGLLHQFAVSTTYRSNRWTEELPVEITHQIQVSPLRPPSIGTTTCQSMYSRPVLQWVVQSLPSSSNVFMSAFSQCLLKNLVETLWRPTPYLPLCTEHWFWVFFGKSWFGDLFELEFRSILPSFCLIPERRSTWGTDLT